MPDRENLSEDRKKLIHRYMTEEPAAEDVAPRKGAEQAPQRLDDELLRLVEPPKLVEPSKEAPRVVEPNVPRKRPPPEPKPVEAAAHERPASAGVEPETSKTDAPAPQPRRPRPAPKPKEPKPEPASAGNEDAVTSRQPETRKAAERTPDAATASLVESCTIRVWNGYVKSQFFASFDQREEAFAVSPAFRASGGNIPERTLKAEGALSELVDQLMQLGWYVVADGPRWFDRRLERRLSRSTGNLTAVPPAPPPTA